MRLGTGLVLGCAGLCAASAARAQADAEPPVQTIEVVAPAPLGGSGVDRARVPAATNVLRRDDLVRSGVPSVLRALDEQVGSVAIDDVSGNRFAPNLLYRGFEASALVGNPQGLAVYVNGARFNQPFGDTVNWDLIPDIAIERTELVGSNPMFGLNALGGAVSVRLRDGFSYQGAELELSGGSFGRRQVSGQYGVRAGNVAAYVAATGIEEDGWRERSPSRLRQIYGTIGWRGDGAELNLDVSGAQNHLTGNGPAPVELLAASRRSVFTLPDTTRNSYGTIRLRGSYEATDQLSLQGHLYYSNFSQRTANGDAADIESGRNGLLQLEDVGPLQLRGGGGVRDFLGPGRTYGLFNRTGTDTNGFGAALQGTHRSEPFGRPNRLTIGAAYDGGRSVFSASSTLATILQSREVTSGGPVIDFPGGPLSPVRVDAANDHYGLYALDVLDLTDRLSLTGSLRLNVSAIRLRDRNGGGASGDSTFVRPNPALGATYQLLPGLSAYAGYAEANRAPTPAELSCANEAAPCTLSNFFVSDPPLKQVVARTWEAGLRGRTPEFEGGWLAGGTVEWHAGLFHTRSSDDILFAASQVRGRGFFQNVGETQRQGVEAGLKLRAGRLLAYADYAYVDATFQSPLLLNSPDNPLADANGQIGVTKGNRLPGVPAHTVKFGLSYQATSAWRVGLTGIAASGRVLRGDESNLNPRTSGYVVLGVNTAYQVTENIELFGQVQNATDRRYETFGTFSPTASVPIAPAPGAANPRSLTPAPPIAGYGGVRVRF